MDRHFTFIDKVCLGIDQVVRALHHTTRTTGKPNPAINADDAVLTARESKQSAALMRVNHTGEICAQALYHGQGLVARNQEVQEKMQLAVLEEGDHLTWCRERILELNSHTSYLNPLWYVGSFCIGVLAGMAGDRYSFGFVAETEKQVIKHLEKHLALLPPSDQKSRLILQQMEADESKHRDAALSYGAKALPVAVQAVMGLTSRVMVGTAYYI